jgi:hypothetical protein
MPGQDNLVPQIDQFICANEPANVVFIALTENLFVHASALLAISEVVAARRAAPTDVQRQLHYATDLLFAQRASRDHAARSHCLRKDQRTSTFTGIFSGSGGFISSGSVTFTVRIPLV